MKISTFSNFKKDHISAETIRGNAVCNIKFPSSPTKKMVMSFMAGPLAPYVRIISLVLQLELSIMSFSSYVVVLEVLNTK